MENTTEELKRAPGMVSTCANSECAAPFLYYGSGRLFVFEPGRPGLFRVESYWLCEECSTQFTLARDAMMNVRLLEIGETEMFRPKPLPATANKLRSGYA